MTIIPLNRITNALQRLITALEELQTPLANYFLTLACIIILRNFLESFSHGNAGNLFYINYPPIFLLSEFVHFSLFYIFIALILTLIVHYLTQENIQNIIKVLFPAFILILSVPCIDLIFSGGKGQHIGYIFPNAEHSWLYYYVTLLNSIPNISWGIRLEIFTVVVIAICYLRGKQKNVFLALLGTMIIYSAIFFILVTPYIIKYFTNAPHIDTQIKTQTAVNYFLLLILPLGINISYLANKKLFLILAKDLRWLRLWHFELMLILGIVLATTQFNKTMIMPYIFLSTSILFFWLAAVMLNNIPDQAIDRIANPERPLVKYKINLKQYRTIAYTILGYNLIYALAVNLISFFIMSSVTFAYYIYSMPPLRLKRIPLLSKAIPSTTSLAIVLLGYINIHGNWQGFPQSLVWIFLIGFTLAANLIDIKDYEGDKANSIRTIPVLLKPTLAKLVIGVAFILTSLAFYFYLQNVYLLPFLALAGILGYYFINQKKYQEWQVFTVYLITIAILIIYILVSKLCVGIN